MMFFNVFLNFFLIEFPADSAELYNVDVNQTMKSGYTPIHLAVLCSSYEIVETLLTNCPIHKGR